MKIKGSYPFDFTGNIGTAQPFSTVHGSLCETVYYNLAKE
jgi:hypothetical protein